MNRLAEFRMKHGFTQKELSKRAGVSRPYISEIETGTQKVITNSIMQKLAQALNETVQDIFFTVPVVRGEQRKAEPYNNENEGGIQ